MKKINSINYGGKVLGIGCVFLMIIPGALYLIQQLYKSSILYRMTIVSATVGAIIIFGFFIHLAMELQQDKKIDAYYTKHKNVKIKIDDRNYECSACGNRKVKEQSTHCEICGCRFEEIADKTPQQIIDGR